MNEQSRPLGVVARRVGYAVAVLVNLVLLFLLNIKPGWQAASFLTDDTPQVLILLNVSLLAGMVANLVYIVADGRLVKTLGDLTTTAIGLAVLIRVWYVFPFDFTAYAVNWGLIVRAVTALGLAGTGIALIVHTVALIGRSAGPPRSTGSRTHALR
jgi:hypothetical protein